LRYLCKRPRSNDHDHQHLRLLHRLTTSGYSQQAIEFANSVEGVILIDGEKLTRLMIDFEVGVTPRLVRVPKLDLDYFEE